MSQSVIVNGSPAAGLLLPSGPTPNTPSPYGLFSVAQDLTPAGDRWVNGIEFEHAACAAVTGLSAVCGDQLDFSFPKQASVLALATPFTLYGSYNCGPIGSPPARAEEYARLTLLRHEQEGAEEAIHGSALGTTPYLRESVTTLAGGAVVSPEHAIGLLSAHAAATYGSAGTIHAPRVAAGALATKTLVTRADGHLETLTGDLLALGGGYPNESPAGAAAATGQAWLYVTPPVGILRTDVLTAPPDRANPFSLLDHTSNDLYALAMRTFIIGWDDCEVAAVLVDISGDAPPV